MSTFGTIQSMIISLKNNKKLLIRRKTFFDRKHSREELKRIYAQKIGLNEKPISEAEKKSTRERIRKDYRRENQMRIAVVLGCIILIPTAAYFAFSGMTLRSTTPVRKISHEATSLAYDESIQNGLLNLNSNQPFFAIGHFENALKERPNDELAVDHLILAYRLLCDQNEKTCGLAQSKIDSLKREVK